MLTTPLTSTEIQAYNASNGGSTTSSSPQKMQDTFLKLLVAQLQNQDPMNPMDNAQMTSQMAQINTVTGIANMNTSLSGISSQFTGLQNMMGASLVGHKVLANGNQLSFDGTTGQGAFSLSGAASAVTVKVMGTDGQVLGSLDLGAQSAGLNKFSWDGTGVDTSKVAGFQVQATGMAGASVTATPMSAQTVTSVSLSNGSLMLNTSGGQTVNYSNVQTIM